MKKFNCVACGLCCQSVDKSFLQVDFDRGDGVCKNFDDKTKLCKIYKNRPIVCNVDAYYEKFLSGLMSREEFHEINYKVCESLRGAENVKKNFCLNAGNSFFADKFCLCKVEEKQ